MTAIYNKFIMIILAAMSMLLASCGSKHSDEPEPPVPPVTQTGRTILVYMVANNNMGGIYDNYDIKEMLRATGDLNGGRLLVYHGSKTGNYLKEITTTGIDTLITYSPEALSVSARQMQQVIADTKAYAPAREYGIVLWSHGSGWLQNGIDEQVSNGQQRSFGLDGNKRMNVTTLAQVLEPEDFSFVYFDCCYMGSIEVAYQLRHATPVIIASPTEDPIYGMPYDLNLKHLFADNIDYVTVAKTTFDYYNDKFKVGDCPCTMTVIKTAGLDQLANATRAVYESAPMRWPEGYQPQRYTDESRCYYYDFGDYVQTLCADQTLLSNWQAAMDAVVVYSDATPYIWDTIPITRCSGLSTYIFNNDEQPTIKSYDQLDWYQAVASVLF